MSTVLHIRLSDALLARLDEEAERERRARATMAVLLLERGLPPTQDGTLAPRVVSSGPTESGDTKLDRLMPPATPPKRGPLVGEPVSVETDKERMQREYIEKMTGKKR